MRIFEHEFEMLLRKQQYFNKLKAGDKVKVLVGNRKKVVTVYKKHPNFITVLAANGCRVCFTMADVITALGTPAGMERGKDE